MISRLGFYQACVTEFHRTFELKFYPKLDDVPPEVCKLRGTLIDEELREYTTSTSALEDLDAICDLIYVIVGTAVQCNIPVMESTERPLPSPSLPKVQLAAAVRPISQEMFTLFPCPKRSMHDLNQALHATDAAGIVRGFKLFDAFAAVHKNNMEKLWTEPPSDTSLIAVRKGPLWLVRRADGKIMKPPTHRKVDLTPYL